MPYAELHCHSDFSFLKGVRRWRKLVLRPRELLGPGRRQPFDGHDALNLPEVRVAGDDGSAEALGQGGDKAVKVTQAGRSFQARSLQGERTVNIDDLDRRRINRAEGSDSSVESASVLKPVNDFAEIHHGQVQLSATFPCLFHKRFHPGGPRLVLKKRH